MNPTEATCTRATWAMRAGRPALVGLYVATLLLAVVNLTASASLWRELADADTPSGVDFIALYTGGRLLMDQPRALYDLDTQRALEDELVAPNQLAEEVLPFAYPPVVAAAVAPLALLGYRQAYEAFGWLNLALLAFALAALAARGRLSRSGAAWLVVCAAASVPATFAWVQGQVSLVALLVTTWFAFDLRDGRASRAGLWVGLLSFKPQLVPVPLVMLAAGREWRALGVAALTACAAWMVFLPRIGWSALAGYANIAARLAAADGSLGVHPERMFNLKALVLAVLAHVSGPALEGTVAAALTVAGAVGLLAAMAWVAHGPDSLRSARLTWAAPVAMLLVSPHVNLHDLSLLLLPVAVLLGGDRRGPSPRTAALAVGLVALPLPAVLHASGAPHAAVSAVPAVLLTGLLLGLGRGGRA